MPQFSQASLDNLGTVDERLQEICLSVIRTYDFSVTEGYRSNERQAKLFRQGKSKLGPGQSKHNFMPSLAVDVVPYPIDWHDEERFYLLAGFMFQAAAQHNVSIRWGGDWDRDWIHTDQSFFDLPHFEIVTPT